MSDILEAEICVNNDNSISVESKRPPELLEGGFLEVVLVYGEHFALHQSHVQQILCFPLQHFIVYCRFHLLIFSLIRHVNRTVHRTVFEIPDHELSL